MLASVMAWLETALTTALGETVIKGMPVWNRPTIVPPIVALQLWAVNPRLIGRTGQPVALSQPAIRVTLFGKNEPDLWRLVGLFGDWAGATPEAAVTGQRVRLTFENGARYDSQTGAEQEQYGMQFIVNCTW